MKLKTGLSDADRKGVTRILSSLLADEYVLYTKARNYHWNVVGRHFSELHKFFEAQYEELDNIIDEVAERIRALGGTSPGTLGEFLKLTRLREDSDGDVAKGMLGSLLEDHEMIIR